MYKKSSILSYATIFEFFYLWNDMHNYKYNMHVYFEEYLTNNAICIPSHTKILRYALRLLKYVTKIRWYAQIVFSDLLSKSEKNYINSSLYKERGGKNWILLKLYLLFKKINRSNWYQIYAYLTIFTFFSYN